MDSNYSLLFTVNLLHEYYSDRKCNDLEIVPTEDCKVLLQQAKLLYRCSGNKLSVFIRQNHNVQPALNIDQFKDYRNDFSASVLRFYLKLKTPLFFNYTNINNTNAEKYYFSNVSQNKESGFLFLSVPVSVFELQKQYLPGNIVKDAESGLIFEALKKYTSKNKTELKDPLLWHSKSLQDQDTRMVTFAANKSYYAGDIVKQPKTDKIFEAARPYTSSSIDDLKDPSLWISRGQGQMQYAGENDKIEFSSGTYKFILEKPVKKATITISEFNNKPAVLALDETETQIEIQNFDKPVAIIPVHLTFLKPGKYTIKVNEQAKIVYYDPSVNTNDILGIIEIFNFLPRTDSYALLTDDERLKSPDYYIAFANRRVLWKYIRKDANAQSITDLGATGYKFHLNGNGFISEAPLPLSQNVLKTLSLEFSTSDFKLFPLPNPSPERFSKCSQNDYDYLCSEIYLNY